MHQQPPKIPLLRSTSSANACHVEESSGRTVYANCVSESFRMPAMASSLASRNVHIRNPRDRNGNCARDGRCYPAGVNDVEQCADREPADTVTSTSTV